MVTNRTRFNKYGLLSHFKSWSYGLAEHGAHAAHRCSSRTPISSNLFGRICLEAGLPQGSLNVVPGGPQAGHALVSHPEVDEVSFTGGPDTGRRIQAACAQSLTFLVLELGGRSANIVFEDADLERAATSAATAINPAGRSSVQRSDTTAGTGVGLRPRRGAVAQVLDSVVVGPPADPSSGMGPVISGPVCEQIMLVIDQARGEKMGELLPREPPRRRSG